jgi:hypothetical protein
MVGHAEEIGTRLHRLVMRSRLVVELYRVLFSVQLTRCLFGAEHHDRIGSNCADHRWQRSKQRDREKCK